MRGSGFLGAPNGEYREKSTLLGVTYADPQAQAHPRGGSADHDGAAAPIPEARKRQHYARPGHVSFDEPSHKLGPLSVESFGRLGAEGSKLIDQLAASVVEGGGGGTR